MAHNIAQINGDPAMFYVGQRPWHGLGQQMENPPETAEEAIIAAKLDWEVIKKPVFAFDGTSYCQVPGYSATFRKPDWGTPECQPFGLVGEEYRVLQNRDAFAFFDPVVETGAVTYETAGALGRGERIWILARVKENMRIGKEDEVERYLLLSTGHDGRHALRIRFTPKGLADPRTPRSLLLGAASEGSPLHEWKMGIEEALKAKPMPQDEAMEELEQETLESFLGRLL